jgi:hypothetical protein
MLERHGVPQRILVEGEAGPIPRILEHQRLGEGAEILSVDPLDGAQHARVAEDVSGRGR